ncbi:MAG: hypothetical protein FWG41_04140 [Methanomassiliicoccaceae archaeon]|nr:hypothetical protein [Methanomassiliicoccaceae archaeon]
MDSYIIGSKVPVLGNLTIGPPFLMVLTGTEYAYKRDDGVLVVPAGCLGL